jgi:hypothetical protein
VNVLEERVEFWVVAAHILTSLALRVPVAHGDGVVEPLQQTAIHDRTAYMVQAGRGEPIKGSATVRYVPNGKAEFIPLPE